MTNKAKAARDFLSKMAGVPALPMNLHVMGKLQPFGVRTGDPINAIFQSVELPDGWKIKLINDSIEMQNGMIYQQLMLVDEIGAAMARLTARMEVDNNCSVLVDHSWVVFDWLNWERIARIYPSNSLL